MTVKLEIEDVEFNLLMDAMASAPLPWARTNPLIVKMHRQMTDQQPKPEPAPVAAPSDDPIGPN